MGLPTPRSAWRQRGGNLVVWPILGWSRISGREKNRRSRPVKSKLKVTLYAAGRLGGRTGWEEGLVALPKDNIILVRASPLIVGVWWNVSITFAGWEQGAGTFGGKVEKIYGAVIHNAWRYNLRPGIWCTSFASRNQPATHHKAQNNARVSEKAAGISQTFRGMRPKPWGRSHCNL